MQKYRVAESFDKSEINKIFFMTTGSFRMGDVIKFKDGRQYKIIDIECIQEERDSGTHHYTRGVLKRI